MMSSAWSKSWRQPLSSRERAAFFNIADENGFILVKTLLFLIVFGLIAAAFIEMHERWEKERKRATTIERLEVIKQALVDFTMHEGRLPCPARRDPSIDDSSGAFAMETDCAAPAVPGVNVTPGPAGQSIRIGALPVRTMNLPDEYIQDAWGRTLTYAVTQVLATTTESYRANVGDIDVVDESGAAAVAPPATAEYILVSHGPDGFGGYATEGGVPYVACNATSIDGENCDGDPTFVFGTLYSEAAGSDRNDDLTVFTNTKTQLPSAITRYIRDIVVCDDGHGSPEGPSLLDPAKNCATRSFSGADVNRIDPAAGPTLYSRSLVSETDGAVTVRATIPARYNNLIPAVKWDGVLMAALFVNGVELSRGMIVNPATNIVSSFGLTGVITGVARIQKEEAYTVEVHIFSLGNAGVAEVSGWAGTMRFADTYVDGVVEIIERGT